MTDDLTIARLDRDKCRAELRATLLLEAMRTIIDMTDNWTREDIETFARGTIQRVTKS